MSRRLFAAGIGTETNVFSPIPTGVDDYQLASADDPPEVRDGITFGTSFRSYADVASRHRYELVYGTYAYALPAGLTSRTGYLALRDRLLDELEAAQPVDGVLLTLHGAMAADGVDRLRDRPLCRGSASASATASRLGRCSTATATCPTSCSRWRTC